MSRTTTALVSVAFAALAAPAIALPAVGLVGDNTLVMFDTDDATVTSTLDVSGVDNLLGIDLRPATGQLIGVTDGHVIVEIDPMTGEATEISTMDATLPLVDGQQVIVDFNPAADRLRFMTGTTNHRINVDTGEAIADGDLAFVDGDDNADAAPMIVAAAYTNSFGQPESTAMYNIDAGLSAFVQQTAPNDGTLETIGELGVTLEGPVGLDVATTEDGTNTIWIAALGGIHTIDMETGAVTESWELQGLEGEIRDLTILTAPAM